ncbi:MAG: leucine-rich repeat protein [Lachnospiraceae bacterium]|nr:leucine-rich repeat protein [Lachnospiraceae bacterium]
MMLIKKYGKRLGVGILSLLLGISILPTANYVDTTMAVENTTITSPKIGNTVTWGCLYFGSYPQGEITQAVDFETYKILQASNEWNKNNILTINGITYKRMKKEDATSTGTAYPWSSENAYHYFKFQPIKWRVIEVKENTAYMISDVVLDTQKYNQEARDVSWNTSTLRSWLNGYAASENQAAVDYRTNNFLDIAFNGAEKESIVSRNNDKITILSEEEIKNNTIFGLDISGNRTSKASAYAQAMGVHEDALGACNYWTSTNGNSNLTARFIQQSGEIYTKGYTVVYAGNGVRAAIAINLDKMDCYQYAGTVSSDGTVTEPVAAATPVITPVVTMDTTPAITTTGPVFSDSPIAPSTVVPAETVSVTPTFPVVVPTETVGATTPPTIAPTETTIEPTVAATVEPTKTIAPEKTADPVITVVKKGSVYSHGASNGKYRVTKVNKTDTTGTVAFIKPIKKTKTAVNIPATITIDKCKFKVTVIEKNAFANNKKLKKVVIGKNITKIKANAFKGCKNLSKITIRTTALTKKSIGKNAFKGIYAKATIQVPKKKLARYKKWLKAVGVGKKVIFKEG